MTETKMHTIRVDDDLWQRFGEVTETAHETRSRVLRQLIRWYVREPNSPLPPRPGADGPAIPTSA